MIEELAAGNPTPFATSTYKYDGFGRRIEKTGNGQTKRYVYDGEDILLEYDGANILKSLYTHGPGIDEPLAITKSTATFFYHQDGLGTVSELTDSTGVVVQSYAYDAYGNIIDETGTVDQPYTYTGREFDTETGLHYYRARYYDSVTGRFLQEDPFGFQAGINFYSYVLNNPANFSDPSGMDAWIGISGGVLAGFGPFAGSGSQFVMVNTDTGEFCTFTVVCLRSGFNIIATVGLKGQYLSGPDCGKDLEGFSFSVAFDIASPEGGPTGGGGDVGGSIGVGEDGSIGGSGSFGPNWGAGISLGFDTCYASKSSCANTPKECEDCKK